jgi:hypothetical protein
VSSIEQTTAAVRPAPLNPQAAVATLLRPPCSGRCRTSLAAPTGKVRAFGVTACCEPALTVPVLVVAALVVFDIYCLCHQSLISGLLLSTVFVDFAEPEVKKSESELAAEASKDQIRQLVSYWCVSSSVARSWVRAALGFSFPSFLDQPLDIASL